MRNVGAILLGELRISAYLFLFFNFSVFAGKHLNSGMIEPLKSSSHHLYLGSSRISLFHTQRWYVKHW
jgi:hypothetical protein